MSRESESSNRLIRSNPRSGFAAIPDDAATPVISNKGILSPDLKLPPPITLPERAGLVPESPRVACFSSAEEEPIVLTHSFRTAAAAPNVENAPLGPISKLLSLPTMFVAMFFSSQQADAEKASASSSSLALYEPEPELQLSQRPPSSHLVRGIRNFGQTCFLNSVLQSLASLEPFMVYLERLVELNQERYDFSAYLRHNNNNNKMASSSSLEQHLGHPNDDGSSMTSMLLGILRSVNGATTSDTMIDTRHVLQAIAKKHPQFRDKQGRASVGKEQQDAEELLQALIGVVVDEAEFDLLPSCIPTAFVVSFANTIDGTDGDEVVSLACSLREMRVKAPASGVPFQNGIVPASSYRMPSTPTESSVESSTSIGVSPSNAAASINDVTISEIQQAQREEKKQEEFEPCVPRVCSEEYLRFKAPLEQVKAAGFSSTSNLESFSDTSQNNDKRLSAAMQIMMTTASSISPSPLCFWMGSVLQCRMCHHVRPIQNTPFFNLPVIPTAVSNYLAPPASRSAASRRVDPPTKSPPSSEGPPCTLEECLEEFTAVERVHDVECRCCTLRRKKSNLEEEVSMLRNAVEGLLARANKRTHANKLDDLKHLNCDLLRAQVRLNAVSVASPDGDDSLDAILRSVSDLDTEYHDDEEKVKLERHDFFKCLLLTRLPSILTIHIQRRYYDPMTNRMSKTTQRVIFPEILDVAPYCAYGCGMMQDSQLTGTLPKRESLHPRPINYRLLSAIEHLGGAFYGHYVCYRRDPSSERWLFISDDNVKVVTWEEVRGCQAYMLFYEAVSSC